MSFAFRFSSILELRRRERDEAGAALGKANQAIARIDDQIQQLRTIEETSRVESGRQRVGRVSVEGLLSTGRYQMQIQAEINQLNNTRSELVLELQRRQYRLTQAESDVKRFERLENKERETQRAEQLRREQADADERSNQAFIRARRRSAT